MVPLKYVTKLFIRVSAILIHQMVWGQLASQETNCHVLGHCHDYYTASGLKASIYALINQKKVKLTDCNKEGDFDALVPFQSTHLIFEINGYKSVNFPVYFAPNVIPNDRFAIWTWGEMIPNDSLPTLSRYSSVKGSLLSVHYHFIDILDIENRLTNADNQVFSSNVYLRTKGIKVDDMSVGPVMIGSYRQTVTTTDGQLLSKDEITVRRGITFESIRIAKPVSKKSVPDNLVDKKAPARVGETNTTASVSTVLPDERINPTSLSVYFDQSSYEIRPQNKNLLDSIADLLTKQPTLVAKLTGYTDNVGDQNLNITLSEYRAKVVENYLKNRGVTSGQLTTKWKGPDSNASPDDIETLKVKARRVIIDLTSK